MQTQSQNFALPQRQKLTQFNHINSSARLMPPGQLYDGSTGKPDAFYRVPYYQNPTSLAAQSQRMCPRSTTQPTSNAFLARPTHYGQAFGSAPTKTGSLYPDSTVTVKSEPQEYNSFLDNNSKNPSMSTMPLQFTGANINAYGTFSMATSIQAPGSLSSSTHSAPVDSSYSEQNQVALWSQSPRGVLTTLGSAPTEAGSLYPASTVVVKSEPQEYNSLLDDHYKHPIMSAMPLQQFSDANINACGTLPVATSTQAPVAPFLCSLNSSTHSAHVGPSYKQQNQVALSSQTPCAALTTAMNNQVDQWSIIPGVDIDPNPIEWLSKEQEKLLLKAAKRATNKTAVSDTQGHLNVPVFELSRIDSCYDLMLGSIDPTTQLPRPVSLDSCLHGRIDNPNEFVFDGWQPGFFTLYMVYNENQKKPKLIRIATQLEDGRKMRKVHLAYLIAREYAKMQLELNLRGFPLFMYSGFTYAGECSRVDFNRIKITHIEIDRTTSIAYPNIVIGYSATR